MCRMELFRKIIVLIFLISKIRYVLLKNVTPSTIGDLESVNRSLCTNANCIMKCCPLGKYITTTKRKFQKRERVCEFDNNTKDLASLAKEILHKYPDFSKLNFTVKAGIFEANETFRTVSVSVASWFKVYLTEYPEVYLEMPNAYERWTLIPNDKFCWDYKIGRATRSINPGIWVAFPEEPPVYEPVSGIRSMLLTAGMLVSCFFLVLVLVVYSVLPELRNLCGLILMAYVASQLAAILLLAIMRIQQYEAIVCRGFTFTIYYFWMASFCWMNVMSYNIWWTSRGYAHLNKARPNYRHGERFKFIMYCLYGFGLPLAMTVALAVINEIDMSHMPWFITPKLHLQGCFIEGGEKFLYMYVPMLILILFNLIFYLMTGINVWRLSRGTAGSAATCPPREHHKHLHILLLYLKLSVVMGLNWILEVVSSKYPSSVWLISDLFNMLIGVTIFIIFVCNRRILKKLVRRWRPGQNSMVNNSSISDVEVHETHTLQVCDKTANPSKSRYV